MNYHNIFRGNTSNEVWLDIYKTLNTQTNNIQESRIGPTNEILHALISIKNPRERWIYSREPIINPAFAIAEIVWIMNGRNDSKFLNFWNNKLPEYAGRVEEYHGAYGDRLRNNFGFDQLEKSYLALSKNPKTRQVVLQIWDPNKDFPDENGKAISEDIPCNIVSLLKVRNGKLEWQQIMRSNDIILGLPYNIIQFTTLQEIMAGWLEIDIGTYNHLSDSLHMYLESELKFTANNSINIGSNNDDLRLKKLDSEKIFKEFSDKIDLIIQDNYSEKELLKIATWKDAPKAYKNLLLIICAEAARKANYNKLIDKFISKCENPHLVQFWNLWMKRFSG